MSSRDSIAFHEVTASFNEEQWLRLDNGQREAYRNAMKEIHLTLIAQGYTILNPSTIFSIKKQNESYVRFDIQSMEMKSAVVGDFPDILMKVKEEPVGETPISQGEHCVSQPSTSSGLASFNNIKQECSTYGSINSGSSTNLTVSSPRTSNAALTKAIGPAEKFPIQALEALISGIPKDDPLPRTSNAALINAEEKRFSIDNSGGGEGTPGNSADQAPFMQALMTPILVFGTQNFILAGNLNVPLRPQEDTSSDSLPKTSNAALITSEEERFSIDDYNRGGGEGTPGNSAGVPGVMKQEPDDDGDEETDNENLENIIPVIVKQEEADAARNDQADKNLPAQHGANITNPVISLIDEAILLMAMRRRRRMRELEKRSRRRYRAHPLMSHGLTESFFPAMYRDLRKYPKKFFNFTQMSISTFDALLQVLRPRLACMDTSMWRNVSPEERLLVTLRFLSTGQTFESLQHCFQLGVNTVTRVTQETCLAIWKELHQVMMPEPTEELWRELAEEFWEQTQFPNCIGALDGKHIMLQLPPNQQSKHSSIVLLGLVDSHCRFVVVDVGAYGSAGDSHIFRESTMGQKLFEGRLRIPPGEPLPSTKQPCLPNVVVADEAFGLTENLMCPYSGHELTHKEKIFNYRLSCVHRMVKCAFTVCTTKWRILLSTIELDVESAVKVVLACCVLHNFVIERERGSSYPAPQNVAQRVQFMDSHPTTYAMSIRNVFADFFVAPEGRVSWQNDYI